MFLKRDTVETFRSPVGVTRDSEMLSLVGFPVWGTTFFLRFRQKSCFLKPTEKRKSSVKGSEIPNGTR